jgi:integrase
VFTAERGGRVDQSNLMSRVLKPAAVAAGLGEWVKTPDGRRPESWVGFHTFRHTCATALFRAGWNAVQVQRWLGHHKPSFTIDTYVHLLEEDIPEPIAVALGATEGATEAAETDRNEALAKTAESAL